MDDKLFKDCCFFLNCSLCGLDRPREDSTALSSVLGGQPVKKKINSISSTVHNSSFEL